MPIQFDPGKALELLRYGKFTLLHFSLEIPSTEAVEVTGPYPFTEYPPAAEPVYHITPGYRVLTERFNWGGTSRPNKVYYELHQFGRPFPPEIEAPEYAQGYYCGAKITDSNVENRCTHIFASKNIHVKLWNCTGASPEDVWVDFTVWYYTFHEDYTIEVYNILQRDWRLLEKIIDLSKKKIAQEAGELPEEELRKIIEEAG